jgi:hypothetical protein
MIGGKVIETIVCGNKVWINCQEYLETCDKLLNYTCAIYVENTPASRSVSEGDIVWWQGDRAMWTARDRNNKTIGKADTVLKKIGFSGVSRPKYGQLVYR